MVCDVVAVVVGVRLARCLLVFRIADAGGCRLLVDERGPSARVVLDVFAAAAIYCRRPSLFVTSLLVRVLL